jgi:hypothetical protein
MIDPDRYRAASGLLTEKSRSLSPAPQQTKRASDIAVEHLDGGCLLYRLPTRRTRDTDNNWPRSAVIGRRQKHLESCVE